jgi:hypothetical protein
MASEKLSLSMSLPSHDQIFNIARCPASSITFLASYFVTDEIWSFDWDANNLKKILDAFNCISLAVEELSDLFFVLLGLHDVIFEVSSHKENQCRYGCSVSKRTITDRRLKDVCGKN